MGTTTARTATASAANSRVYPGRAVVPTRTTETTTASVARPAATSGSGCRRQDSAPATPRLAASSRTRAARTVGGRLVVVARATVEYASAAPKAIVNSTQVRSRRMAGGFGGGGAGATMTGTAVTGPSAA